MVQALMMDVEKRETQDSSVASEKESLGATGEMRSPTSERAV